MEFDGRFVQKDYDDNDGSANAWLKWVSLPLNGWVVNLRPPPFPPPPPCIYLC